MAYPTSALVIFTIVVAGIFSYPLDSKPENDTAKESFRPVSLPTDFGSYDPNANGYIDLEELAKVTGTTLDDARKPFMDADIDDDDQVSPAEFEKAPWSLSVLNREEVVSEDDNEDDDEGQVDDDGEEAPIDDNDGESDDVEEGEETPVDATEDGEEAPTDEFDDDSDMKEVDQIDDNEEETQIDDVGEGHADDEGESQADDEGESQTDDEGEGQTDDEGEGPFDVADDILVDVGKYGSDDDDDDAEKYPVEKSNEEPSEEYDLQNAESDDAVDPLLVEKQDPLSKQQDVISENEFVENAIF